MAEQTAAAANGAGDKPEGPSGGLDFIEVDGLMFPKRFENHLCRPLKEHFDLIRAMEMREDDIILCAYAKSGTHWSWEVGSMLLAGKAVYEKRTKVHVMMEVTDVEKMQAVPSPRLLNTHVPVRMLPNQVKSKKVKVIHVYRNPKDVLVSMFYHMQQSTISMPPTFDMLASIFMTDKCLTGNYFKYLKDVDSFIKDNPDIPVFNMSFEEMKEDSKGTVQKLAKFLQVEASEELCDAIADACSFHKLKEADKTLKDATEIMKENNLQIFRKGEVGDWKNHLTVAVSEQIDKAMEGLKGCDYRFRYTL